MGEGRSAYGVLVGKLEGKRPLGRPGHIWKPIDLQKYDGRSRNGLIWLMIATSGGLL